MLSIYENKYKKKVRLLKVKINDDKQHCAHNLSIISQRQINTAYVPYVLGFFIFISQIIIFSFCHCIG